MNTRWIETIYLNTQYVFLLQFTRRLSMPHGCSGLSSIAWSSWRYFCWQRFIDFRATRSQFRSVKRLRGRWRICEILFDGVSIYIAVYLRLLPSCCKTIRHISAALCRFVGPGYAKAVRDIHVRWLFDFSINRLILAELRTYYKFAGNPITDKTTVRELFQFSTRWFHLTDN